jgi:16S rRNA (adenine1518-N6/adenine1519-N6)-dimethyltransferase
VTAIEVDPEWARATALALVGRGALDLRISDALKTAVSTVAELARRSGRPPMVVSNLPYSIASRLIVDLVQARVPPERLVVMVQAEVAARITAAPGSSQRGLLTLMVQLHATARRRLRVPRGAFTPPPKVESAVVEIVPDAERSARARERPILPVLLKAAFQARRKTLRRGIAEAAGDDAIARVPPQLLSRRPEQMTEEQWLALADVLAGPPAACNAI